MAKNIDVMDSFVNGDSKPKTKNLYIDGDKLINYGTVIAERHLNGGRYYFTVNTTKYSMSTTAIQNQLQRLLTGNGISYSKIEKVRMGAESL